MEEEATQPGSSSLLAPQSLVTSQMHYFAQLQPQNTMAYDPYYVATQIVVDPRRLGQGNSGLNDEDLADICCILHPASLPAYRAAALIHDATPQHTISFESDVKIREKEKSLHIDTFELAAQGLKSCDIALRLSADLKDPMGGFHFGRNATRCDFVIGNNDASKRISNIHFRIYINEYGIIMLEDQSTNGTAVDGALLRGKDKENGSDYRHTLEQGSIIHLTMTPPEEDYRFIVRIPQRDEMSENAYQQNLTAFFLRVNNKRLENEARAGVKGEVTKKDPLNLFPTPGPATPNQSSLTSVGGKHVKEWRGGAKYNKICCIGKGAFAVVYKISAKFDGVPYAAKELEKRRFMKNGILDQKVDSEMKIMRKIKHPNVVQYIEHIDWEEYLYIIMEYVPGGDLGSVINEHGHLPESNVKSMAAQLLSALKYLHKIGITHRDVKPDNILIYSRDPFHVKLTDFGLSKMIDSEETFLRTFCGTLLYCAPEVYSEYREYDHNGKRNLRGVDRKSLPPQRYGNAVDVWSLAGVLFYALCGSPPYPVKNGTSYQELLNQIMTQALDIRPLQRANVSESGIRFVRKMLHIRPEHRATIEELERTSWLTGGPDSTEISMEEDEVDLINGGYLDAQLEEGTSQLSINPDDHQINDNQENGNGSDLTEMEPLEISNGFNTSDSNSNENAESYRFMQGKNPGGRLFGEVNVSAVGSSGAIPLDQLNLPVLAMNHRGINSITSEESRYTTQSGIEHEFSQIPSTSRQPNIMAGSTMPNNMPPPPTPHLTASAAKHPEDERTAISSSLMGAESMVGHLNMHSPSSAASPAADSPAQQTEEVRETRDNGLSLRRPREEDTDGDESWRPADLPAKRRRKSAREIDIPVPPSIFWDPKDKSTHHTNYPRMSTSDFEAYQNYALSKGEKFIAGQKTFEMTMQSFRTSRSRSSSLEPENTTRAHSEPTKEEGRRMLMKRDERQLADNLKNKDDGTHSAREEFFPPVEYHFDTPTGNEITGKILPQPVVGNDFHPPKRILAKLIATPDSCLPTITLNITESLTTWGRGFDATIRYSNANETRIPKYAFKIFLFKPGFYAGAQFSPRKWSDQDQDMSFYISTKASLGIWVNDIPVTTYDRQNPSSESKFWGQLRHGDLITVFRNEAKSQFVKLRFECYWGKSKETRQERDVFWLLQDGPFLKELEDACLAQQEAVLAEIRRRKEDEQKMIEAEKEKERLARQGPSRQSFDFNHSFIGAPSTT